VKLAVAAQPKRAGTGCFGIMHKATEHLCIGIPTHADTIVSGRHARQSMVGI
jgi:hypothetical protein